MYKWVIIGVLALALTGTAIWGMNERQEKNDIRMQAENNYQRSFHELTYRIDTLHDKIGATLAMNSRDSLSPQLAEIWRLSSEAHTDVGQLPLALMPFEKTEKFLTNIGDFTYKTAVRDLDKEPLSEEEMQRLEKLHDNAGQIKDELRNVQNTVLGNNLHWSDVEMALSDDEPDHSDNAIISSFETVENSSGGFNEEKDFNNGALPASNEEHKFEGVTGERINQKQAKTIAAKAFDLNSISGITGGKSGKGSDVPLYSLSYKKDGESGYADISQKGGHILTLMMQRDREDPKLGLHDAQQKAQDFLVKQKLTEMEMVQSSQYDSVGIFFFVPVQDDVRIYADIVQVKVALDNGDILGYNARDYFMNHHERDIAKPKLTEEQATEKLNQNVQVQETHLALIENDTHEETLVYEIMGTRNDETYRIYVNADTGQEEEIEKQTTTEARFLQST
ncbi:spore germination protein [Terribacillus halophilus]|uniref:Spore germination protein n=1 Tax=Terribacillus halophilus TaxID=361279 RepID=A0A1G6V219_9BACI|nr:germination protein YpeB [Terribacillus halophilus]SDD46996.1 spore germination protein [Terribacillus halophilus]